MQYIIHLIIGGSFILIGSLVKGNPMLIAGYNTMPETKRKNVDIEGLSTMMRNYLMGMGVLQIAGGVLFAFVGWKLVADIWPIFTVLVGVLLMVIKAQKYDHNKKSPAINFLVISFIVLLVLGVAGFLYYSMLPPNITTAEGRITIGGSYGTSAEVQKTELMDSIGAIVRKTNGFHLGSVFKGNFDVEGLGNCLLFIDSTEGPFILIQTSDGRKILINAEGDDLTAALINTQ